MRRWRSYFSDRARERGARTRGAIPAGRKGGVRRNEKKTARDGPCLVKRTEPTWAWYARYETRNTADVQNAAIITFRWAVRRPRLIRIQPIVRRMADAALSVAFSAGRSETDTSGLVRDHQDPQQR